MNKLPTKRKRPTDPCQYAEKCYRKNPHHFMEYSHEHLDKIISEISKNENGDFKIPENSGADRKLILEQVKIINELYPSDVKLPESKRMKTEDALASSTSATAASVAATVEQPMRMSIVKTLGNVVQSITPIPSMMSSSVDGCTSSSERSSSSRPKIDIGDYNPVVAPKGKMADKLKAAHPYNYFLTAIPSSPETHSEALTVTFQELLDPSLGELESSVQINFMIEPGWLLAQYYFAGQLNKPLLLLYGSELDELQTISQKKPNIKAHYIRMGNPFATHHTKMMLFKYKDNSMRVVISTANLYEADWHNRTQGLWISDKLPQLPDGTDTGAGECSTEFRNELLKYLTSYKLTDLQPWLVHIRKADFSSIKVFLVTSIPGAYHETTNGYAHGHARISWLLSKFSAPIEDNSPIVAQCSSIGSLGTSIAGWISSDFINSFRRDTKPLGLRGTPSFRLIYPSFNNVSNSHDGLLGGGCLPYGSDTHQKQPWLQEYLYQWRADCRYRSRAMPHIKTYCRWTNKRLHWFMLTSANLSKAAWGTFNKTAKVSPPIRINNYEAGVLFLPKFISKTDYFSMDQSDKSTPVFPMHYDIPLKKYAVDDTPFLSDLLAGL